MNEARAAVGVKRLPLIDPRTAVIIVACCVAAALLSVWLKPTHYADRGDTRLSSVLLPVAGKWREVKSNLVQMSLTPEGLDRSQAVAATYDDSAMTSYVDPEGNLLMVALAYGRSQRQEGKIHRPELCYSAQGFSVNKSSIVPLRIGGASDGGAVQVHRLEANSRGRREIVSYWIRIGDLFSGNAFQTRTYIMKSGLGGSVPDGILFRVSQIVSGDLTGEALERAYQRQEQFMSTLSGSLNGNAQKMLLGDRLTAQAGGQRAPS
jgi:EpsI family protein